MKLYFRYQQQSLVEGTDIERDPKPRSVKRTFGFIWISGCKRRIVFNHFGQYNIGLICIIGKITMFTEKNGKYFKQFIKLQLQF